MGGAVSAGRDNNHLIDNLIKSDYIKTREVEMVFRAVDRADYILPEIRKSAYKDMAWRSGIYHLSAPCIYSEVMEHLMLQSGHSFLNLGSGTGYLSTMAGLILGTNGTNHGVEIHADVVRYAMERMNHFIHNSPAVDEFDFCEPKFVVGNCLCLSPTVQQYDRVYCGASCPKVYENYLKNLIKIGGILVMPSEEKLYQIKRISETQWSKKRIQCVSFASLVKPPSEQPIEHVQMMDITPPSLQVLCRTKIRNVLRNNVYKEHPELYETHCTIQPGNIKMKRPGSVRDNGILLRLPCESNDDFENLTRLHNLDDASGAREMNALLNLVLSMGSNRFGNNINFEEYELLGEDENSTDSSNSDESNTEELASTVQNVEPPIEEVFPMIYIENLEPSYPGLSFRLNQQRSPNSTPANEASENTAESISTTACSGESCSKCKCETPAVNNTERVKLDSGIGEDEVSSLAENRSLSPDNVGFERVDNNSSEEYLGDNEQIMSPDKQDGAKSRRTRRHRKRHLDEDDQDADVDEEDTSDINSTDRDSSSSKLSSGFKTSKKSKKSPARDPCDMRLLALSSAMKKKIVQLPLPLPLKKYVNMTREV